PAKIKQIIALLVQYSDVSMSFCKSGSHGEHQLGRCTADFNRKHLHCTHRIRQRSIDFQHRRLCPDRNMYYEKMYCEEIYQPAEPNFHTLIPLDVIRYSAFHGY